MGRVMDSNGGTSSTDPRSVGTSTGPGEREKRLSRQLVEFYKGLHGRGPIAARTTLSPELATTVLYEILTPGEQTLVVGGRLESVEQMRLRTADLLRSQLIDLAEEALGVEVTGSVTGIGVRENVASETFLLAK